MKDRIRRRDRGDEEGAGEALTGLQVQTVENGDEIWFERIEAEGVFERIGEGITVRVAESGSECGGPACEGCAAVWYGG